MCPLKTNPRFEEHKGLFPHNKILIVVNQDWSIDDDTFIYCGSHNITSSAWGKLNKNGNTMSCVNTELGVCYPPKVGSAALKRWIISRLPFGLPVERYSRFFANGEKDRPYFRDFN